jgi:hypothetical protein
MEHHAAAFFEAYCDVSAEQFTEYYTLFFAFDTYMSKHAAAPYMAFVSRFDSRWLLNNYITTITRGIRYKDRVVSGVSLKRWVT